MTNRPSAHSGRGLAVAYAATVFLSAFLLFQVQPLLGKYILPWFGGSPAVWTTCMLVFQVLLFAGYAYAHLTTQYLSPRRQGYLHIGLLVLALVTLPITPDPSLKPTNSDSPALKIVLLALATIGLPYFILSSTGPLIQGWFSRTNPGQSPYRLYSLSNIGSLLALLSYPFLVEPTFSTNTQSILWSVLFGLFALLCSGSAVVMWQRASQTTNETVTAQSPAVRPSGGLVLLWFGLAMTPSVMLLATTNQVCLDVAVIPFLWILPLAPYLLTFIVCFDSDRWYRRRPYSMAAVVLLAMTSLLMRQGSQSGILLQIIVYFSCLFCCCMVCHGELAALKPHPRYLTAFYLTISAGGAAGGLFVGILAPLIFVSYYELQFAMISFAVLYACLRLREDQVRLPVPRFLQPLLAPAALVAGALLLAQFGRHAEGSIAVARNFYGVLKVERHPDHTEGEGVIRLAHGRIEHGSQFLSAEKRRTATAYYSEASGVGQLLQKHRIGEPRHIGVVGLGVGTLTAYGRATDRFRLYEINPDVITMAQEHFTYLRDCPAEQTYITGDARLAMEFESPQQFDILVLDAFSGDAIPVHLLTREAFASYLKHLKSDGVLACHISNLHFDLRPVISGLAEEHGLSLQIRLSEGNPEKASFPAIWAMLSPDPQVLARVFGDLSSENRIQGKPAGAPIVWTDDRSNLMQVLW